MKNKKVIGVLFFVSILLVVCGYVFANPQIFNLCELGAWDCTSYYVSNIGQPMFLSVFVFPFVFLILFFTKSEVFKMWSKFALIAIPLLALWIVNTPVQCGGGYIAMCLTKEMVSIFSSVGFLIVSLAIIAYKSFTLRTKNNLTN